MFSTILLVDFKVKWTCRNRRHILQLSIIFLVVDKQVSVPKKQINTLPESIQL